MDGDPLDMSRREFMLAGTTSLLGLSGPVKAQVSSGGTGGQPVDEYEFQGVADLMGPADARPDPGSDFFDNKAFYAYRYEATDTNIQSFITKDDVQWTQLGIGSATESVSEIYVEDLYPAVLHDQAYVDHPLIDDVEDAWTYGQVAVLGTDNYGDVTFQADAQFLRGVGSLSECASIDTNNNDNCIVTFAFVDQGSVTMSGSTGNYSRGYAVGSTTVDITGNVNRFIDNSILLAGDVTVDGGYNLLMGNVNLGSFGNVSITVNGNNNVVAGNTGVSVVDNGSGNQIGFNT